MSLNYNKFSIFVFKEVHQNQLKYVKEAYIIYRHIYKFKNLVFSPWRFYEEFVGTGVSVGKFTKKIPNQGSQ